MPNHRNNWGLHGSRPRAQQRRLQPVPAEVDYAPVPRWITVSGLERGAGQPGFCNERPGAPGQDYFAPQRSTLERLAEEGFVGFRIPFRWERMQPVLGGPLDPDGVQELRYLISSADRVGKRIVLALHNRGSYRMQIDGTPTTCGLEENVGGAVRLYDQHLAEFWSRMSHALCGLPNVYGYSLGGPADDLPDGAWQRAGQAAVDAIREDGNTVNLLVAGNGLSHAETWDVDNPRAPWLEDPLDKLVFEARCHLDHDASGSYARSFDEELGLDPELTQRVTARLRPFVHWLAETGARGAITEFGVDATTSGWTPLLDEMLQVARSSELASICWKARRDTDDDPPGDRAVETPSDPPTKQIGLFGPRSRRA
ncbi:MAG: cellulase family glycosylhydrolase [Planctomycetota bacterium]|nr:cellulase family glycosylhydrolase [Planctomycetota bacterium]